MKAVRRADAGLLSMTHGWRIRAKLCGPRGLGFRSRPASPAQHEVMS